MQLDDGVAALHSDATHVAFVACYTDVAILSESSSPAVRKKQQWDFSDASINSLVTCDQRSRQGFIPPPCGVLWLLHRWHMNSVHVHLRVHPPILTCSSPASSLVRSACRNRQLAHRGSPAAYMLGRCTRLKMTCSELIVSFKVQLASLSNSQSRHYILAGELTMQITILHYISSLKQPLQPAKQQQHLFTVDSPLL